MHSPNTLMFLVTVKEDLRFVLNIFSRKPMFFVLVLGHFLV